MGIVGWDGTVVGKRSWCLFPCSFFASVATALKAEPLSESDSDHIVLSPCNLKPKEENSTVTLADFESS
jgi:hypothetical protein